MSQTALLTAAVEHALRAPSVHNSQPWLWRIRPDAVELHADWNRHLPATDPDRRDLVMSCGAALHHLEVGLAAQGLAVQVRRMPDPEDRGHLATVGIRGGQPDLADAALLPAIDRRRTDRRRMSRRPVAAADLADLAEQARRTGGLLLVTDPAAHQRLTATLADAAFLQASTPGYAAELQRWTHRYAAGRDGVSATSVAAPAAGLDEATPLRRFAGSGLHQPHQEPGTGTADDAAELLVIITSQDTALDWLHAGEATSAVLLAATTLGLATTPLSQALEVEGSRRRLQQEVLRVPDHPQLVIRVGWPAAGAAKLPVTPRRELTSVLLR